MKLNKFLIMGIPAFIFGFIASFILAKFVLGLPADEMTNAVNNGLSGLGSTVMGFIATYIFNKKKFLQKV